MISWTDWKLLGWAGWCRMASLTCLGPLSHSPGMFTGWHNGFSSERGQAPMQKHFFKPLLEYHLVTLHWQTSQQSQSERFCKMLWPLLFHLPRVLHWKRELRASLYPEQRQMSSSLLTYLAPRTGQPRIPRQEGTGQSSLGNLTSPRKDTRSDIRSSGVPRDKGLADKLWAKTTLTLRASFHSAS